MSNGDEYWWDEWMKSLSEKDRRDIEKYGNPEDQGPWSDKKLLQDYILNGEEPSSVMMREGINLLVSQFDDNIDYETREYPTLNEWIKFHANLERNK